MKKFLALCAMSATWCACTENDTSVTPPTEVSIPISWHIEPADGSWSSRALIEGTDGKTADEVLQDACTPELGGQSIGIWADLESGGTTWHNIFADVELIYQEKADNHYSHWNYPGEPLVWNLWGVYSFRAYYPRSIKDYVLSTSNATTFVIEEYNTASMQEDVLVAYRQVDANRMENVYLPVKLNMQHALSAMQFRFRFEKGYEDADYLTSFWLQNAETRDFANVGLLIYGTADNPEQMNWQEAYQPLPAQRMYYWENNGLLFDSHAGSADTVAVAYTANGTTSGAEYTGNNGNILIIPQTSDGTVNLCFTTRNGGNTVYRVPIPKGTGTGIGHSQFIPGCRYVYTITITETNLRVDLSIAPWNLLKSSFDLDLNK